MIGTIRKHQSWLWAIIITLTILSFVIFGSTNSRVGNFIKGDSGFGEVGGKSISREQWINALNEVELGAFLKTQQWPEMNSAEMQKEVYMRILLVQKQKDLGIEVSPTAAAVLAKRILGAATLDDITEKVLKPRGLDAADFERYLRHELGIEQMVLAAGVSGKLVTPGEAETIFRLEHQELEVSLAYFSASNYLSSVTVTPENLARFYTNQQANYRVPPQVQVSYVKFNVTNYLDTAIKSLTNLDQIVSGEVQRLGTNLFRGAKTAAESKTAIHDEVIREAALRLGLVSANQFLQVLDSMTNRTAAGFKSFAASSNLTVVSLAPFGREYGPQEFIAPEGFAAKAFGLTPEDPFSGSILGTDGIYILALEKSLPSQTPSLAEIKERVTADYRFYGAMQLVQQAVLQFNSTVTNGLAAGKTWDELCAQAGVKPQTVPPFSLSSRALGDELDEKINFATFKQLAFGTPVGKSSPPAPARDGAYIMFVRKALPVSEALVKSDLPKFLDYMRQMRQNDSFNQWFNTEIRKDPAFMARVQKVMQDGQMKSPAGRRPPVSHGADLRRRRSPLFYHESGHQTFRPRHARILGNPGAVRG